MRTIKTIILRLYLDSDAPGRLCGDLQIQPDRKTVYFQNEAGLVDLLHQLAVPKTSTSQISLANEAEASQE